MADKLTIPNFPNLPDFGQMITQACEVIANVRGIPYDFNGTLSLENKFVALFKTVKEMFDAQDALVKSYKELYYFVTQFFTDENFEKVVYAALVKMKENGELEEMLNNILAQSVKFNSSKYSVCVHSQKIIDSKIDDIAQGFCTDGNFFYMLHHIDDSSPLKLLKLEMNGNVVSDTILTYDDGSAVTGIHGNSLNYFTVNDKTVLFAAFAGDNPHNILRIDSGTYKCVKLTSDLNISALACFEVDNRKFTANVVSRSQAIVVSYIDDNNNMIPFTRYMQMSTVPNLKQGILATTTHIYLPYSALYNYRYNMIRVYTHGLENTIDITILDYPEQEIEDLGRVSGKEILYWNDNQGNIYSIDTTGVIGQSRDTVSLSAYEQALPHYMVAVTQDNIGTVAERYTSNSISVTKEWNLPTCYHRTWSGSVYGSMEVLGAWTPISVSPFSGALFINGTTHLWDGTKYVPLFYRLQYDFTDSADNIGTKKMSLKAFLFSAGNTDYVYSSNATTVEIDKATKWLHDKFGANVQYITRYAYFVYNTTLNAGSCNPTKLFN